jgi:N-acetylmuramoyl-L-alanine amidase
VPRSPAPLLQRPDSALTTAVLPSRNHGARLGNGRATYLVLHYTGMADGPSAIAWLCNPDSQVSCHYVVEEGGAVLQLVAEDRRAWHAGRAFWEGCTDLNSASIGIEIVNGGHDFGLPAYPAAQIASLTALCRDIVVRRAIRPDHVLAHSDIAPGRKQDPGELFPWQALFRAGVGLWVPPRADEPGPVLRLGDRGETVRALQAALASYGYGLEATGAFDAHTEQVVRSFQRHFRPARVDGLADSATVATLRDLLAARVAHVQPEPMTDDTP